MTPTLPCDHLIVTYSTVLGLVLDGSRMSGMSGAVLVTYKQYSVMPNITGEILENIQGETQDTKNKYRRSGDT